MGQSELLASALVGGFVLYLAMNNRLATYWAFLTGGAPGATAPASSPPATTASSAGTAGAAVAQVAGALAGAANIPPLTLSPASSPFDFLGGGSGFGGGL